MPDSTNRRRAGLFRYLKEAFAFRWNLLLLGGASVAAVISGHADVALPLVAAAEVTYLAGLSSLPRFQAAIDARAHAEERGLAAPPPVRQDAQSARDRIVEVLKSLSEERRARFLRLRSRCVEMTRIANAVRGETQDPSGAAVELRQPALDRLLWVFLKLLLSDQAIARFLQAADAAQMQTTIDELASRIAKREAAVPEAERADDRILRSLHDGLATAQLRKDNLGKAQSNAEFVAAELDRLENKIQAVTEMAVSHSDPNEMSSRIDAIAEGISQTEQTIRELQTITGMTGQDEAPSILGADIAQPTTLGGGSAYSDARSRIEQARLVAEKRPKR
jgi:chemotaxis protein histidine kinase CheA